jgi:uncharacterized protein YbcC (UPF0753/DUF2309 family)
MGMPKKSEGFYNAWRKLAVYDTDMPKRLLAKSQKQKMEALDAIMDGYSSTDFTKIFTWHSRITGLYINHQNYISFRMATRIPITLEDYLAVRVVWLKK